MIEKQTEAQGNTSYESLSKLVWRTKYKVALIFKEWLPSVIQEIEPYVSSEDIDKGARWSTDIAKELEDSTFGILCVTRENVSAPWLMFEAGALSKTMDKSFVCPFLFDIKRSEIDGPVLQFQSTIFEKDDLQKLVNTLNKACKNEPLTQNRLDRAFSVWYPTLETELNALRKRPEAKNDKSERALKDAHSQEILEEILDLSRRNQILLRNPEASITDKLEETHHMIRELIERQHRREGMIGSRSVKNLHPRMLEELLRRSTLETEGSTVGIQMTLAMIRDEFPWIYETGMEAIKIIKSRTNLEEKENTIRNFIRTVEFSFEHPLMRDRMERSKEWYIMGRELPHLLEQGLRMILNSRTNRAS